SEGKLILQKNIAKNCVNNCFPINRFYTLHYCDQRSTEISLTASSELYILQKLPRSTCTTVAPDVQFSLYDMEQDKIMVEGIHYAMNTNSNQVIFYGEYSANIKRLSIGMSYSEAWQACAGNIGIDHKNQLLKVVSYMTEEKSSYKYDEK